MLASSAVTPKPRAVRTVVSAARHWWGRPRCHMLSRAAQRGLTTVTGPSTSSSAATSSSAR